jgi:hypothetical protein
MLLSHIRAQLSLAVELDRFFWKSPLSRQLRDTYQPNETSPRRRRSPVNYIENTRILLGAG